eukprot:982320-Pyramimonas_sp.AAC.1
MPPPCLGTILWGALLGTLVELSVGSIGGFLELTPCSLTVPKRLQTEDPKGHQEVLKGLREPREGSRSRP